MLTLKYFNIFLTFFACLYISFGYPLKIKYIYILHPHNQKPMANLAYTAHTVG